MSLRSIVQALGGELYDGGRRANIPAPGHSAEDRSVSLLLQDDRVVVHTFGDGDWKGVLDFLRDQQLIDNANAPLDGPGRPLRARPARPLVSDTQRRDAARRLWEPARAIAGTVSERHCRLRGVRRPLPGSAALRHNNEAAVSAYGVGKHRRPALLAGIQDAGGAFTAVEVTYLAPNGQRAIDLRLSRKTVGPAPSGCAVRLDPAAPEMLVAEGVFTTLSATEWFGLPGWALMSTRNLRAWTPPHGVCSVLIAADRGKDGEASAARLKGRLIGLGLAASVALPPEPWGDWNEWLAPEEVAAVG
jgi:putative DNA primase/helicase